MQEQGEITYTTEDKVQSHLHLVVNASYPYQDQGLHLYELIQEGTVGLIRAVEEFPKQSEEICFDAFAQKSICMYLERAIEEVKRPMFQPIPQYTEYQFFKRAESELTSKLGRPPTTLEIAQITELSVKVITSFQKIAAQPIKMIKVTQNNKI